MRTIHYHVINKNTNKSVYVNCRQHKAEEFLASLPNAKDFEIRYKWVSI